MKKIIAVILTFFIIPSICYAAFIDDYTIAPLWIDVDSNYGDELNNPFIHADGMRTSQVRFTYNTNQIPAESKAYGAVYDSSGRLINVGCAEPVLENDVYKASYNVRVPETQEYSMKFMLWDSQSKPISDVWNLTSSEFKTLNGYKVQNIASDGKYMRRATFENDTYDFFTPLSSETVKVERTNSIIANSGDYCVKVSGRTSSAATLEIIADGVDRSSVVTASCYVRNIRSSNNETFYLQGIVPTLSGTQYVDFGKKTVKGANWTKLNAEIDLSKYANITGDVRFRIINGANLYPDYYADDFLIMSSASGEAYSDAVIGEVKSISYDGSYIIRTAFENNTFGAISINNMADYFIDNEVTAATGHNYLNITNRVGSSGTLMIYLDDISEKSVVNFECWVRNKPGDNTRKYLWQAKIPTAEKNYWIDAGEWVTASDKGWKKLSGNIDLSQYTLSDTPMIQIVATGANNNYFDFLVDDILIMSDSDGELIDDTLYEEIEKSELLSETPAKVSTKYQPIESDIPSLKDVYKDYFKIGACIQNYLQADNTRYGQLIKKHFNSVVSDGLFNMCELLPDYTDLTAYNFEAADALMDFAVRNGIEDITGHCLIWESGRYKPYCQNNGKWKSRSEMLAFLEEYITKVIRHFEGDGEADEYKGGYDTTNWHMSAWNVANEAVGYVDGSGKLQYVNKGAYINCIGTDYVDYAFKYAEEAGYDDVELRYNDYNENEASRAKGMYTLVKNLKDNGRRVDAIGMQSHYYSNVDAAPGVRDALDLFTSLGVKVDITEMDVQAHTREQLDEGIALYEDGIPRNVEFAQTRIYEELFDIYKEYSDNIDRVTFWSIDDRFTYYNSSPYDKVEYTGVFNRDFQAKPQYWAIADPDELRRRYPEYDLYTSMSWDFEDDDDITTTGENGKWTYAVADHDNPDIKLNPYTVALSDVIETCEFGSTRAYTKDTEYVGEDVKSPGSKRCAVIPNNDSDTRFMTTHGMKVSLSDKQLVPGKKYKMTFYVTNNHTSRGVRAKLLPKGEADYYLSHATHIPWMHTEKVDIYDAITHTQWGRQEIILSPSTGDFNDEGYTSLYLMFTRNPLFKSDGSIKDICPYEMFYVDDIKIEEIVSSGDMEWTFDNASDFSTYPELGKWTYATRDNHNGYYNIQAEYRYNVEKKNYEYIKRVPGYGITDTNPDDKSPKGDTCAVISNDYTYDGARNWPAKMGVKVKLSKEQIVPGRQYKLTFYGLTNNAEMGIYFKLKPYGQSTTKAFFETSNSIPWIDIYANNGTGAATVSANCNLQQHWEKHSWTFTPEESDFDENGYTNLWMLAAPGTLRYADSAGKYQTATITPGAKVYIDDMIITEVQ